jgi:ATP-grasp domain, R2K clade family 3
MAMHFVFPRDPGDPARAEEMFADQWNALTAVGFSASLCSDAVLAGTKPLRTVPPGCQVVYRGWMVKKEEYVALVRAIEQCGATAFIGPDEYLSTHHLPNWYPMLSDLTPETRVYPADADLVLELSNLDWGAYFLKDYVKSLKTARGSIVREPAEAPAVIAEMREYRGEIEGGICVRRVEEFIPGSERRYFVLHGVSYAAPEGTPVPDIVRRCAERLPSKFFSVDVALRRDGELRVVEVGDGQVSDLVGWSPAEFASMWRRSCDADSGT